MVVTRGHTAFPVWLGCCLAACAHAPPNEPHTLNAIEVPVVSPAPGAFVPVPQAENPPVVEKSPGPASTSAVLSKSAEPTTVATKRPVAPLPAAPAPAAKSPQPQLDFQAMEQRLRDTSAIGVFTKLSIKNQVDDLLKAFRAYHGGKIPPTLDELHGRFDGLLLKVVTLVQDDDATLASSISASRGAIWEKLSNKASFESI
jgi:hypothetical protein